MGLSGGCHCGASLTCEWSADRIDLAVFAFDDPSAVAPAGEAERAGCVTEASGFRYFPT